MFFNPTSDGNGVSCGNITSNASGFRSVGQQVLADIQTATPKIKGFYAATKTQVANGTAIYAVAQCVETATEDTCLSCMQIGYNNLESCLPNTEGRAYDAGCFMRYSTTPFFADNQTIDIAPFLKQGTVVQFYVYVDQRLHGLFKPFLQFKFTFFHCNNADFCFIVFSFTQTTLSISFK